MWIFLSNGFVSITRHNSHKDFLHVRARNPQHLLNIWPDCEVQITPHADYTARTSLPELVVVHTIMNYMKEIDYSNFKNTIDDHQYKTMAMRVWDQHFAYGKRIELPHLEEQVEQAKHYIEAPDEFLHAYQGTGSDANALLKTRNVKQLDSPIGLPNEELQIGNGSLTLCGLSDFEQVIKPGKTVVTMSRYPQRFPHNCIENEWIHCHFRFNSEEPFVWTSVTETVVSLIEDGHDVVLHCIKGKDRTGKVAYMVLREYGYSHEDAIQTMGHIRPVCEEFWTTKNFEEYLLSKTNEHR
ncbi:MAG: hypothetical protein HN541_00375 [Euryarchaeota archaeon]|jgi:hypothetical protein|nr:hypothetical protein [Euryarchaeota archaeon]